MKFFVLGSLLLSVSSYVLAYPAGTLDSLDDHLTTDLVGRLEDGSKSNILVSRTTPADHLNRAMQELKQEQARLEKKAETLRVQVKECAKKGQTETCKV